MSLRAIEWAFTKSQSTGSARLVLLVLADHADQDGFCWPGWARIAHRTKCGRTTIARALNELEQSGEIQRVTRGGGFVSTKYRMLMPEDGPEEQERPSETGAEIVEMPHEEPRTGVPNRHREGSQIGTGGVPNRHPGGAKSAREGSQFGTRTVIEPSLNRQGKKRAKKPDTFPAAFYEQVEEAFIAAYAEANQGAKYLGSYERDRAELKKLFQRGVTPETLVSLCWPFMLIGRTGRDAKYWASKRKIADLCQNINHEDLAKARSSHESTEAWE